ncbi:hypothetical protein BDV98DRAFT_485653, partial [Pterulicium gracile]
HDLQLGTILACELLPLSTAGQRRLTNIVLTELALLIWKTRNRRVIDETPGPSKEDTLTRWLNTINSRLQQDCASTNTYLFGKRAAKPELIMDTWRGTL